MFLRGYKFQERPERGPKVPDFQEETGKTDKEANFFM